MCAVALSNQVTTANTPQAPHVTRVRHPRYLQIQYLPLPATTQELQENYERQHSVNNTAPTVHVEQTPHATCPGEISGTFKQTPHVTQAREKTGAFVDHVTLWTDMTCWDAACHRLLTTLASNVAWVS